MKLLSVALVTFSILISSWTNITPIQPIDRFEKPFNGEFTFFRTHRQAKGITATWGVVPGNTISEFTVQRTYDDPTDPYAYWEDLGPSVIYNGNRSYKYTEETVFPGYISYRIVAKNGIDIVSISEVLTEHIIKH